MIHITHSLPQIVSIVSEEALYIFLVCFAKFFLSIFFNQGMILSEMRIYYLCLLSILWLAFTLSIYN